MMLSPEMWFEEEMLGKTQAEQQKIIDKLRREISELKNPINAHKNYLRNPSDEVIIAVYKEYIYLTQKQNFLFLNDALFYNFLKII